MGREQALRFAVAALVLALGPAGCRAPAAFSKLTYVTSRADVVDAEVLKWRVEGESCFSVNIVTGILRPPWRARPADHGAAIADALSKVEGAELLTRVSVNVKITQYILWQTICSQVVGDARRLR